MCNQASCTISAQPNYQKSQNIIKIVLDVLHHILYQCIQFQVLIHPMLRDKTRESSIISEFFMLDRIFCYLYLLVG